MSLTHTPVMIIVCLFAGAFVVPVLARWAKCFVLPVILASLGSACVFLSILWNQVRQSGGVRYFLGGWAPPWGIEMYIDGLSIVMLGVLFGVGVLVFVYSIYASPHELPEGTVPRYHALNLLLLGSMCGMVMAGDVFNLYVFMEISSLAACGTIAVKGTRDSVEATLRYFILSELGSGCILMGIAILYMLTGNLNMGYMAQELPRALRLAPVNVMASAGLMTIGFLVKAALFPLHVWLPDAHSAAPSASSAILSGLVVKVAPFALWRMLTRVYTLEMLTRVRLLDVLLVMATLGVLIGSIMAMGQRNLKRMLAFSTVGQVGYIFLGLGLASETAVLGAFLQIMNHAIIKACLFMAAGIVAIKTGIKEVSGLAGIGRRMPFTMGALSIAALSMIGIPPLNGFMSKWYLAKGALEAGRIGFVVVVLLGSLLVLLYCFPLLASAFFGKQSDAGAGEAAATMCGDEVDEAPFGMLVPLMALSVLCVALGLFPQISLNLLK